MRKEQEKKKKEQKDDLGLRFKIGTISRVDTRRDKFENLIYKKYLNNR